MHEFVHDFEAANVVANCVIGNSVVGIFSQSRIIQERGFVIDDADRHSERIIDLTHPYSVASRQIVIDRDYMHSFTCEGIQIRRQSSNESLALARAHLGNIAIMQDHPADELYIEMTLSERTPRGFPYYSKGLGGHAFEGHPIGKALPELGCFIP